jgi:hypothetical protein
MTSRDFDSETTIWDCRFSESMKSLLSPVDIASKERFRNCWYRRSGESGALQLGYHGCSAFTVEYRVIFSIAVVALLAAGVLPVVAQTGTSAKDVDQTPSSGPAMTSQRKGRWLPRFGMKTLFAIVLVVAAYFGSWPWLEERAHKDVKEAATAKSKEDAERSGNPLLKKGSQFFHSPSSVAPFVLRVNENDFTATRLSSHFRYYVWLFGWSIRLPITSSLPRNYMEDKLLEEDDLKPNIRRFFEERKRQREATDWLPKAGIEYTTISSTGEKLAERGHHCRLR